MSKTYIVVAEKDELSLIPSTNTHPIIITGVGAINVISALRDIPKDSTIINYGYAGGLNLKKGEWYAVNRVSLYHPNVNYPEPAYECHSNTEFLNAGFRDCYTSCDFVTKPKPFFDDAQCLFDMELAFICALGFSKVISYKKVSDNCDYQEYKETINGNN